VGGGVAQISRLIFFCILKDQLLDVNGSIHCFTDWDCHLSCKKEKRKKELPSKVILTETCL
jgi:hypothetical protein